MSDKVLVPVELLQKIVDALRIANDWNLDELNIEPPEEWGLELPEDCNGVMEGWCYTTDFANHIESLIEAEPEPVSAEPVAWMHPNALENFKSGEFNRALVACEKVDDYTIPLYTSQSAQEWQPIETAPKDGTEILLFSGWDIGLCYWRNDSCFLGWTWGAGNRFNNPSHWMPLPQPPGE